MFCQESSHLCRVRKTTYDLTDLAIESTWPVRMITTGVSFTSNVQGRHRLHAHVPFSIPVLQQK